MKTIFFALFLSFLLIAVNHAHAEEQAIVRITRAAVFSDGGQFRAAIDEVEPLLRSDQGATNDATTGIAWNIRGFALQGLGNDIEARRSYDSAIDILRALPEQRRQYASALDNLGSLEQDSGHFDESRSLRTRAMQIYASAGDRAGVARTLTSLALNAIARKKLQDARQCIAEAFHEESLLSAPEAGALGALFSTLALEQEREGHYQPALDAAGRAIEIWTQHYGPQYYLLSAGYSLRGRAYDGLRDYSDATDDMQRSLQLMEWNGARNSRVYFLTKLSYAQVLRHAGIKDEAAQTEAGARAALSNLREPCGGCVISTESLSSPKGTGGVANP